MQKVNIFRIKLLKNDLKKLYKIITTNKYTSK